MKSNPKSDRRRNAGMFLASIGFLMILANACDYILGWNVNLMPLLISGLGLVLIGMNLSMREQPKK